MTAARHNPSDLTNSVWHGHLEVADISRLAIRLHIQEFHDMEFSCLEQIYQTAFSNKAFSLIRRRSTRS